MVEYHYIITIKWDNGRGSTTATFDDMVFVYPGDTRKSVYADVLGGVCRQAGVHSRQVSMLFFSLERDVL